MMKSPQSKGGIARAKSLSKKERKLIASNAARSRWGGVKIPVKFIGEDFNLEKVSSVYRMNLPKELFLWLQDAERNYHGEQYLQDKMGYVSGVTQIKYAGAIFVTIDRAKDNVRTRRKVLQEIKRVAIEYYEKTKDKGII